MKKLLFFSVLILVAIVVMAARKVTVPSGEYTVAKGTADNVFHITAPQPKDSAYECWMINFTTSSGGEFDITLNDINGQLTRVTTDALGMTDDWDLVIYDFHSIDVLYGDGANRDTHDPEEIVPLMEISGTDTTVLTTVVGCVSLQVDNGGDSLTGSIRIYVKRR